MSTSTEISDVDFFHCRFRDIFACRKISNMRGKPNSTLFHIRFTTLFFSTSCSLRALSCILSLISLFHKMTTLHVFGKMFKCKKLSLKSSSHINILVNRHFEVILPVLFPSTQTPNKLNNLFSNLLRSPSSNPLPSALSCVALPLPSLTLANLQPNRRRRGLNKGE